MATDPARTYPSELSALALRETVVFPLTLQPLAISRPISIESVNRALASDRLIFLSLQTTDSDDPTPHASLLHDAAEGGLAVALAECALFSGIGAEIELPPDAPRRFGEGGGQAIVACDEEFAQGLRGVPLRRLGVVGGDSICGVPLNELRKAWS